MPLNQLTPLPKFRTDMVTRRLCATVHLDHAFARQVLAQLAEDGLQAVGLPFGINVVALVRHARLAAQRRGRRDNALAGLVALQVLCVLMVLWALSAGSAPVAVAAGFIAVAALPGGWTVVLLAEREARQLALELGRGHQPASDLAPPVEPELEKSLEQLKRANFVPYHSSEDHARPFVGSGWLIQKGVWTPIDVSRPAKDAHGNTRRIIPFDASDLHHYLAVQMPGIVGLDALKARNRLYAHGLIVAHLGPDVLPVPTRRPLVTVPKQMVQSGAVRSGARTETYLCLRMAGEGGSVVVTMHIRAHLMGSRLDWEVAAYILPPLDARFDVVDHLPAGPGQLWWQTARHTTAGFRHTFFGAPGRLRRERSRQNAWNRQLAKIRKEITKGRIVFDYGAHSSLREDVGDWDRMGFHEERDAAQYFQRLQQGVLIATERFLEAHNVDTSDFESAQNQIINTQTYNIQGPVLGPSQWGNNNQQQNQNQNQSGNPGNPPNKPLP
ncbi:hypothetical protein ACFO3J_35810 [Streptomyces polygonati]|uniref:Aromatic ring-opening dioxygenase LigA n=1 Tax=Streptomyces polygonati TaxID=1617087 RepID=A0ABV8I0A8_9ACTN